MRQWELLVVDNASEVPLAGRIDLSWHPSARLFREDKLGLTPARLRGIREAAGNLLVFVDDDNVLAADFLSRTLRVAEEKSFLGAWSGQCHPGFERPPPDWTRLDFHQCPHCPLAASERLYCPLAVQLAKLMTLCERLLSPALREAQDARLHGTLSLL